MNGWFFQRIGLMIERLYEDGDSNVDDNISHAYMYAIASGPPELSEMLETIVQNHHVLTKKSWSIDEQNVIDSFMADDTITQEELDEYLLSF